MGKRILTALVVVQWSSHHLKASREPKIHFNKQKNILPFGKGSHIPDEGFPSHLPLYSSLKSAPTEPGQTATS